MHNEVFKAAESRINIECLPLARGDESLLIWNAQSLRIVCPSQEGMNHISPGLSAQKCRLPLARGDESLHRKPGCRSGTVCPSQEGMNRSLIAFLIVKSGLPLARGDESYI